MKLHLTSLIIILFTLNLNAQWKIGPKVSYGTVTQEASEIRIVPMRDFVFYDLQFLGGSDVKSIGFMAYNDLGPVFLQSEMMATTYSLDFALSGYKSSDGGTQTFREQYYIMEIPFNAGIKIKNFKVGLGPVLDVLIDIDSEMASIDDYRDMNKSIDFGFQGMIGYNLGILHIDFKYVNKFSSITDAFALGFDEMKYKKSANRMSLSIGVNF